MGRVRKRQMTWAPLAFATFLCVSGGAFGLEPLMAESGAGMGLAMILLVAIVWAVPIALKTAELGAALPHEGGYYVWVKRALGPFAGFLCAWWTWLYSMVDAALYPVLFAEYLAALTDLAGGAGTFEASARAALGDRAWAVPVFKWAIAAVVVAIYTAINVRGVRTVGRTSVAFSVLLLAPFAIMAVLGWGRAVEAGAGALQPFVPEGKTWTTAMMAGMYVAMWNYLGWDSLATIAEEVEEPGRAYPRSLFASLLLTVAAYGLPAWVGLAVYGRAAEWKEGLWPAIGATVGGPWLGMAMAAAALFSAMGLFMTAMLAASRIPYVLAEDGYLARGLTAIHPRFGTPARAILVSGAVYLALSALSFTDLLSINVILYSAALLLQFAAFLVLRRREPNLPRPFRVPGGWPIAWSISILPAIVLGIAVWNEVLEAGDQGPAILIATSAAVVSGPIWHAAAKRKVRA